MASNEMPDFDTVKKDLQDSILKLENAKQLCDAITIQRDNLTQEIYHMKNETAAMKKQRSEYHLKIQKYSKKIGLNVIELDKEKMRKEFFKNFAITVDVDVPNVQEAKEKYKHELDKKQELTKRCQDLLTTKCQVESQVNEEKFVKTQQDILSYIKRGYQLSDNK